MFGGEPVAALIVAAGLGRRMGGVDKVLALLHGRPVLAYSVETFLSSPHVDEIVVVLHPERFAAGRRLAGERGWPERVRFCTGGERRQDSVRLGLAEMAGDGWVLIHDGARPLFTTTLIERGLTAATTTGAAVPGLPPVDTIKQVTPHGLVRHTLPRDQLRAIQTPQVFRLELIRNAHQKFSAGGPDFTDDAALLEALGWPVVVFPGEEQNLKITTPEDLTRAAIWLEHAWPCSGPAGRSAVADGPPDG